MQDIVSKDSFVGTWKLIDFKCIQSEQIVDYPLGKNPQGYLIYTKKGYMCASIMKGNRLNLGLSIEEIQDFKNIGFRLKLLANAMKYIKAALNYLQAAKNYISYSGTYEIVNDKVIHHVTVSLVPDWIGTDLERTFEFAENQLILIAPTEGNKFFHLTWERV